MYKLSVLEFFSKLKKKIYAEYDKRIKLMKFANSRTRGYSWRKPKGLEVGWNIKARLIVFIYFCLTPKKTMFYDKKNCFNDIRNYFLE